jgi:hypothetical protein
METEKLSCFAGKMMKMKNRSGVLKEELLLQANNN